MHKQIMCEGQTRTCTKEMDSINQDGWANSRYGVHFRSHSSLICMARTSAVVFEKEGGRPLDLILYLTALSPLILSLDTAFWFLITAYFVEILSEKVV